MNRLLVVSGPIRKLCWRSLVVDLDANVLTVAGQAVSASPAEARVIAALLSRRNSPVTKEAIRDAVFTTDPGRDARQIDVFIARLRRMLAMVGLQDAIVTIPGRGYAMLDDVSLQPAPHADRPDPALLLAA